MVFGKRLFLNSIAIYTIFVWLMIFLKALSIQWSHLVFACFVRDAFACQLSDAMLLDLLYVWELWFENSSKFMLESPPLLIFDNIFQNQILTIMNVNFLECHLTYACCILRSYNNISILKLSIFYSCFFNLDLWF